MRPRRLLDGQVTILGGRFPKATALVAGLTLGLSVLGALTRGTGLPLAEVGGLTPVFVWVGQVWRLVTWVFFELEPIPLVFALLIIMFVGRDLTYAWGPLGFLRWYVGLAAGLGAATCLVGILVPGVLAERYAGPWASVDALIVAWAALYPSRQILVYFVIPVGGRNLIVLTVGGTLLVALMGNALSYVPHFFAEAFALAWAYGYSPRSLWLRLKARTVRFTPARRPPHLRAVDRDDEPPRWLH